MKPCTTCNKQPTVTVNSPWWFEFVGSCHIECCGHHVKADGMADAIKAWEQEPRPIHIGEITSL